MKVIKPTEKREGAGARIKRLFPSEELKHLDPFVLLDEFFVDPSKGFPPHEHRGFEAITYMLDGGFRHKDDLGNDSTVYRGGVQKFTAGLGITHSEMPAGEDLGHGFQLWVNLPGAQKNIEPDYMALRSEDIPEHEEGGNLVRTIVGEGSPLSFRAEITYRDVHCQEEYGLEVPEGHIGLLYLYSGEIEVEGISLKPSTGISVQRCTVRCAEPSRFILLSGKPLGEKISLRGSFVE